MELFRKMKPDKVMSSSVLVSCGDRVVNVRIHDIVATD